MNGDLGCGQMISNRGDIITGYLTHGDVTFVFDITSDKIDSVGLSEMVHPTCSVEINIATACSEIIKNVEVATSYPYIFSRDPCSRKRPVSQIIDVGRKGIIPV